MTKQPSLDQLAEQASREIDALFDGRRGGRMSKIIREVLATAFQQGETAAQAAQCDGSGNLPATDWVENYAIPSADDCPGCPKCMAKLREAWKAQREQLEQLQKERDAERSSFDRVYRERNEATAAAYGHAAEAAEYKERAEAAEQERDARFTEADVEAALEAAGTHTFSSGAYIPKPTIMRLLAEHKAQQHQQDPVAKEPK